MERVNSAGKEMGDVTRPGVRAIVDRLKGRDKTMSPEETVEACLLLLGDLRVSQSTRDHLVEYAAAQGDFRFETGAIDSCAGPRVAELLQLIVATREYQLA